MILLSIFRTISFILFLSGHKANSVILAWIQLTP